MRKRVEFVITHLGKYEIIQDDIQGFILKKIVKWKIKKDRGFQ